MQARRSPMARALALAADAAAAGEVPVGAVVMRNGLEVAAASNSMTSAHDPTAHAEIVALRRAGEALGRIAQAFALGIVTCPADQVANGFLYILRNEYLACSIEVEVARHIIHREFLIDWRTMPQI